MTELMPFIENLIVYPIKSLDGIWISQTQITAGGALSHDRELALLDENGNFVNGKRYQLIHKIRAKFDEGCETVTLHAPIKGLQSRCFHLVNNIIEMEAWFSEFFGSPIRIRRNKTQGFPDDTKASGPTVISKATIEEVSSWFPSLSVQDVLKRFRPNIIVGGVPAFWEDRLFGAAETVVDFKIGGVLIRGINPCQRCVVPSRDPLTGEVLPNFQKTFTKRRAETMPDWVATSRFDHYYRLSVNTRISSSEGGKVIRVGDEIQLISL
jgi:uncharacterized protein YcbX